jgi:hypothetical protein
MRSESIKLAEIRDYLLPKLLSGEVRAIQRKDARAQRRKESSS